MARINFPRIGKRTKGMSVEGHKVLLQPIRGSGDFERVTEVAEKDADYILVLDASTSAPLGIIEPGPDSHDAREFRNGEFSNVFITATSRADAARRLVDRYFQRSRDAANQIRFGRLMK